MTEVWRRNNDTCRSYLTKFLSTHTPSKSIAVITNKLEDYDSSLVRVFKKVKAQDDKMDDMFLRARIQRLRSEDDLVEEETDSDCNEGSGEVDVYSLSSTKPAVEQMVMINVVLGGTTAEMILSIPLEISTFPSCPD